MGRVRVTVLKKHVNANLVEQLASAESQQQCASAKGCDRFQVGQTFVCVASFRRASATGRGRMSSATWSRC